MYVVSGVDSTAEIYLTKRREGGGGVVLASDVAFSGSRVQNLNKNLIFCAEYVLNYWAE